jgi:CRISPR-associated endonuclease/helicase Cas3
LVSARLYDEYLPLAAKRDIALSLSSEDDARTLAIFLSAAHDLGKASPVFLADDRDFINELNDAFMGKHGLHVPRGLDRTLIRHEVVSAVLIKQFLLEEGVSENLATSCAIIVGSHHGRPLSHELLASVKGREDIIGLTDPAWQKAQREIFDYAAVISGATKRFAGWHNTTLSRAGETILMGFVVAADWGASSFGLTHSVRSKSLDIDVAKETERAVASLDALTIPARWTPNVPPNAGEEFFHTRFGFPPRPVQKAALDAVRGMEDTGLMIVEAPMGEGKTEAALAVAEVVAAKTGASGVFLALPTIATSDAIFSRARSWVSNLPGNRNGMSMYLSHSRSGLNGKFSELLDAATPDSAEGSHVNKWLARGTKLGPLSNFVVGTIDQVLVSALASKHVTLRHLALANKVVVLDEVHAYDAYMNVYLGRALQWLGYYGVPVVLLSATLPTDIRKNLVAAYNDGLNSRKSMTVIKKRGTMSLKKQPAKKSKNHVGGIDLSPLTTIQYPLISVLDKRGVTVHRTQGSSDKNPLAIRIKPGGGVDADLAKRLHRKMLHGGCVGVFRNTVARSQSTYDELSAYFAKHDPDTKVMLLHSRFIGLDRAVKEERLNLLLGKDYRYRPKRLIVVGTQVIEQSLDIDFDEIISDVAPIDSVMQRAGRLHRHYIPTRPRIFQQPTIYVAGVGNWDGSEGGAPSVNHSAEAIYARKTLFRTVHSLRPYVMDEKKHVRLPKDIPMLVRRGYGDRVRPPADWRDEWNLAEREWRDTINDKRERADSNYLLPSPETDIRDWESHVSVEVGETEAKAQAQVRDITDEEEVLIVKAVEGKMFTLDGEFEGANLPISFDVRPDHETALAVAASMIRLRGAEYDALESENALFDTDLLPEWATVPVLRHKKILVLDQDNCRAGASFFFHYNAMRGLETKVSKATLEKMKAMKAMTNA